MRIIATFYLLPRVLACHSPTDVSPFFEKPPSTDNGLHLGNHRLGYGKLTPYEEDIYSPLTVRGPKTPAGATDGRAVDGYVKGATLSRARAGRGGSRHCGGLEALRKCGPVACQSRENGR